MNTHPSSNPGLDDAQALPTPSDTATAQQDQQACRALLRNGSRTFLAASHLLPAQVRDAACALYAFCRIADDAVDAPGAHAQAVRQLSARLDKVYAGAPDPHPYDRALTRVVQAHAIPRPLFDALLEGFQWDAEGRRYETLEDVMGYGGRVAGTVGAMMALLMGVRSAEGLARACDLGVAMQLSNIARDVAEDARNQRLYLPRAWMRDAGIDPDAWLAHPEPKAEIVALMRRLVVEAQTLYERVGAGVAMLPFNCRAGINAARHLYAAIGLEAARSGVASLQQRTVVSPQRKARLLARSLGAWLPTVADPYPPPALPCTQFLVDAVLHADAANKRPEQASMAAPVHRVLELFERMGRDDLASRHVLPLTPQT
jgi:15-cis-phytoene synthase